MQYTDNHVRQRLVTGVIAVMSVAAAASSGRSQLPLFVCLFVESVLAVSPRASSCTPCVLERPLAILELACRVC